MGLFKNLQKGYLDGFKARSLQHLAEWAMDHNRFSVAQRATATSTEIMREYHLISKPDYMAALLSTFSPRHIYFHDGMKEADRRYQMTQQCQ